MDLVTRHSDVRELSETELESVSGGIAPLLIVFGAAFAVGFAGTTALIAVEIGANGK